MGIQFKCPRCDSTFSENICSNCGKGQMYIEQIKISNWHHRTKRVSYAKCSRCGYEWGRTQCPYCGAICSIENNSSSCFLTTACCEYKKLPDDCEELTILRNFRDTYMQENEIRKDMVSKYYRMAPYIIEAISKENEEEIYNDMYLNLICKTIKKIKRNQLDEAFNIYSSYVQMICEKYGYYEK